MKKSTAVVLVVVIIMVFIAAAVYFGSYCYCNYLLTIKSQQWDSYDMVQQRMLELEGQNECRSEIKVPGLADWKTYQDQTYDISFEYPGKIDGENSKVKFSTDLDDSAYIFEQPIYRISFIDYSVIDYPTDGQVIFLINIIDKSIDEIVQKVKTETENQPDSPNFDISVGEERKFGQTIKVLTYYSYKPNIPGGKEKHNYYFVDLGDNKTAMVEGNEYGPDDISDCQYENLYDQILETLKFE